MIEIINIFFIFFILLLFITFPFPIKNNNHKNFYFKDDYDKFSVNFLFNITLIFFVSFSDLNLKIYFYVIVLIGILLNLYYFRKFKNYLNHFKNIQFIFFIIVNFVIFLYLAQNPVLAWDGLENWFFKTQLFFLDYNFFDLKDVKGLNYYPHFGTVLWAFFWKNSLLANEYIGRLVYVFIYLLSIFSVCELIKKKSITKILIISFIILLCFDDFLFRGYQEILLFSFFIFLSKHFYYYLKDQKNINLLICFTYLNLLPWIKHEGYLLSIVFTISLIFFINNFYEKRKILAFVIFTWVFVFLKNFLFQKYIDLNMTHGVDINFLIDTEILKEFLLLFPLGIIVVLFKYKIWIFILCVFLMRKKLTNLTNNQKFFFNFLKINLILYFILIIGIYYNLAFSGIELSWWIDNSLDRILFSISGLFIISLVLTLDNLKYYNLK